MVKLIRLSDGATANVYSISNMKTAGNGAGDCEMKCDAAILRPGEFILVMDENTRLYFKVDNVQYNVEAFTQHLLYQFRPYDVEWAINPAKKPEPKAGAELIADERKRQVEVERYSQATDAVYKDGELLRGAGAYLLAARERASGANTTQAKEVAAFAWPWRLRTLKVTNDLVRNLVKAGALIAAEIDRIHGEKK